MLFHHIVTMVLLGWSYEMGYHRVGVLVLICHDASDVFLDSAKCFHYIDMVWLGQRWDAGSLFASLLFVYRRWRLVLICACF